MDCVGMGSFGEEPQGEILLDYEERPQAARERDGGLEADFRRDRARAAAGRRELMMVRRLRKLLDRFRGAVRNDPRDLEFQAEMEEHVRLLAERYRGQGMTGEAALLAARRQFGNAVLLQENR